jgi:GNAT superfamily N-acetyltransferase
MDTDQGRGAERLINDMSTSIDFATANDLESLADLLAELFTLESDFKPERHKQITGLRLILDNPAIGQLFVLRVNGQIAGMANALSTVSTAEGRHVLLLEDMIIDARFRGQQLGRRLVEHVLEWAATNGMPRVTLLADQDNTPALAFYQQLGFTPSAMRVLRKRLHG